MNMKDEMISSTDSCPSREEILAYASGQMNESLFNEIDSHIDQCDKCLIHLDNFNCDPEFKFSSEKLKNASDMLDEIKCAPEYKEALEKSLNLHFHTASSPETSLEYTFSDFKLIREVGRGGMGVVYEAEQISLNRRVAMKILPYSFLVGAKRKQRFQIESQAIAILQHPNIIPIYYSGEEKGNPYYAMLFVEGINLEQFIQTRATPTAFASNSTEHFLNKSYETNNSNTDSVLFLATDSSENKSLKNADKLNNQSNDTNNDKKPVFKLNLEKDYFEIIIHFGIQAANALQHAHEMGIIHRDIKPSNMMINESGQLWITDFGLARINSHDGVTFTGDLLGSVRYMSPEQALGNQDQISNRTDLYSLGVTLYELVTLKPFFPGDIKEQIFQNIINQDPVPPRKINPHISKDLETIILKATSKEIGNRYGSSGELAADLKRMLNDQPIYAKRPTLLDRVIKWSRRRKAIAATIIASFILLSAVSFIFMVIFSSKNVTLNNLNETLQDLNKKYEVSLIETRKSKEKAEQSSRETVKALKEAKQNNYITTMKLASEAAAQNDSSRVKSLISQFEPKNGQSDIRGLEWFILNNNSLKIQEEIKLSDKPLHAICRNDKQNFIAIAGAESILYLLDSATLETIKTISTDQIEINGLDFTKDGKQIASTGDDGTVQLWNTETGVKEKTIVADQDKVFKVKYTPDEKNIITSGTDFIYKMWDRRTGKITGKFKWLPEHTSAFDISKDGKFLVTGGSSTFAVIWNINDQKRLKRARQNSHPTNLNHITSVAFSKDQKKVAIGYKNHSVCLWDVENNAKSTIGFHNDPVHYVFFSEDEQHVFAADSSGTVKVWSVKNSGNIKKDQPQNSVYSQKIHNGQIYGGIKGLNHNTILTVGKDGYLKRSYISTAEINEELGNIKDIKKSYYSRINNNLVFCTRSKFYLFKNKNNQFIPLWEVPQKNIWSICLTEDSKHILTGFENGEIHVWDSINQKHITSWNAGKGQPVTDVLVSHDNKFMIYSLDNEKIKIHHITNGIDENISASVLIKDELIGRLLKISPDGKQMSFCNKNSIFIWDFEKQEMVQEFLNHLGGIEDYIFSRNGKILLVSDGNRSIHFWDIKKGVETCPPWKHNSDTYSLELTPDERTLITTDKVGMITFWNFQKGQPLYSIKNSEWSSSTESNFCYKLTLLNTGKLLVQIDPVVGGSQDYFEVLNFGDEWNEHFKNSLKMYNR